MNKKNMLTLVVVGSLIMLFGLVFGAAAQNSDGLAAGIMQQGANDDNPAGAPEIVIPEQYRPPENAPMEGGNTTEIYFTPQDQSTSVTIIFLYNTSATNRRVLLETFNLDGTPVVQPTEIMVPAGELVRIASDQVDTASGSWQQAVFIEFTTASTYGRLTMSPGVKADAYVAWNNGPTYDPIDDQNTLPLRFSSDPATVLLPTTLNN